MATTAKPEGVARDFKNIPLQRVRFEQVSVDLAGAELVEGRVWENTTDSAVKIYLGGTIQTIAMGGASLTTEQVQDIIGAMAADTATLDVTYNDAGNAISFAVLDSPTLQGADLASVRSFNLTTGQRAMASAISDATTYVDGRAQTISDATKATILGGADAAWDTLQEIKAFVQADESTASALATTVATKVTKLTAATITAGSTTTTITTTSRDCGCAVRFNDGDYEDVDAIVERPTATSMLVRIVAQSRDVRVIPWQA